MGMKENSDRYVPRGGRRPYNRQSAMRNGSNGAFTVKGINRVVGANPNRRGGYQGPDTRGAIRTSLGWSGGGTTSMQTRRW